MRFVPIKTDDRVDLHATQRRTAGITQIRAFLFEHGIVFAPKPGGDCRCSQEPAASFSYMANALNAGNTI
jgi:hypothetical protein